jgi:hypothetical protein
MKLRKANLFSRKMENITSLVELKNSELQNIKGGNTISWKYTDGQWKIVFKS